jgi:hypothetical protein
MASALAAPNFTQEFFGHFSAVVRRSAVVARRWPRPHVDFSAGRRGMHPAARRANETVVG